MEKLSPIRVRIRGFQSLEDVELEVHGFTCVTGKTNIGKSAIIRAISGALMNSPVTGMVRKGEKHCTVELEAADWGFKWEKGEKGINRYWLPGVEKPLDKVGAGQIDEVAAMGFQSVKVGQKTVQPWFAHQFDPIFLMRESGPAITDFISEVSRLKVLQDAIIINARAKRRGLDKAKLHEEAVTALRGKEASVSQLDNLLKVEEDLEAQLASVQKWGQRVRRGEELAGGMEKTAACMRALLPHKDVSLPVDRLGKKIEQLAGMHSRLRDLEAAALQVHALRAVQDLPAPAGPDPKEMEALSRMERFSGIPELMDGVEALRGVEGLKGLEKGDGEAVGHLLRGAAMAKALEEAEEAVNSLSREVPSLPEDITWDGSLERAARIAEELEALRTEEGDLSGRLRSSRKDLTAVEKELASIPTCPSCERPIGPKGHPHSGRTSARP